MSPAAIKNNRRIILGIFAIGLLLRLIWQVKVAGTLSAHADVGEASRVAISLARGFGFADAFFEGSGPTAHLLPINTTLSALTMTLFGIKTAASGIALLCLSLAQVFFAYAMLLRLFKRLGVAHVTLRWSLIALCILPVYAYREVIDFRYWDGALALGLSAASLSMIVGQGTAASMSLRAKIKAALLATLTFVVSPVAGVAVVTCWAVFSLRTEPFRKSLVSATVIAASFALIMGPWVIRNHLVLGTPILVRSNAGLELALANHPAALSDRPAAEVFAKRLVEIHPFLGQKARASMTAAGGEVAYFEQLGQEAKAWIVAHPDDFARLTLRHIRQLYFPERWLFLYNHYDQFSALSATVIPLVNAIGLLALAFGLISGRRGYGTLATYFACVTLSYACFQPVPRYTYLLYGPLLFVAFDGIARAFQTVRTVAFPLISGRSVLARVETGTRAAGLRAGRG